MALDQPIVQFHHGVSSNTRDLTECATIPLLLFRFFLSEFCCHYGLCSALQSAGIIAVRNSIIFQHGITQLEDLIHLEEAPTVAGRQLLMHYSGQDFHSCIIKYQNQLSV